MNFHKLIADIKIPQEDAAFLTELYDSVIGDEYFSDRLQKVKDASAALDANTAVSLISEIAAHYGKTEYAIEALCLLLIGADAKARYDALHIEQEIYTDCMADIAPWMRMCKKETGEVGTLHNFDWLNQPMVPRIIKLGRLQFEMFVLKDHPQQGKRPDTLWAMPGNIPQGIPALNVHIPEGQPLSHEACLASYARAKVFFAEKFNFVPQYFCCHSWLLAPELKEILPQDSNILKFAADFDIICTDESSDAAWRIFGSKKPLPQDTALQRAAKAWFDAGNKIGAGQGIIKVKSKK